MGCFCKTRVALRRSRSSILSSTLASIICLFSYRRGKGHTETHITLAASVYKCYLCIHSCQTQSWGARNKIKIRRKRMLGISYCLVLLLGLQARPVDDAHHGDGSEGARPDKALDVYATAATWRGCGCRHPWWRCACAGGCGCRSHSPMLSQYPGVVWGWGLSLPASSPAGPGWSAKPPVIYGWMPARSGGSWSECIGLFVRQERSCSDYASRFICFCGAMQCITYYVDWI